jgi:hypothetical protein
VVRPCGELTGTATVSHCATAEGAACQYLDMPGRPTSLQDVSVGVIPTRRPMPGRQYQPTWELGLRDQALAACRSLPQSLHTLTVVSEMVGPIGVPDLTAVIHRADALTARLESDVPPLLHQVDAGVVAVAQSKRARSSEALATSLGWPVSTVERRIPALLKSGALVRHGIGSRYVRPPELATIGRMYAIETKVRNWGRALAQARGYSVWADTYVLVMGPLTASVVAKVKERVTADRGGLVVDGKWVCRPLATGPSPANRLLGSEYFIAALTERSPTLVGSVPA